jgi:hypothetical protein
MFTSILVIAVLLAALASALRSERRGAGIIARRPYNNRYSDATAARDGKLH